MINFLKTNFQFLVIVALGVLLFFQRTTETRPDTKPIIIYHTDTAHVAHTGAVTTTSSKEIKYVPYPVEKVKEIVKEVSTDTAALRKLVEDYYAGRDQKHVLKIDSIGTVEAITHTTKNKVDSVAWKYDIKERIITNTITIKEPYKPRTQVYVGGSLSFSPEYKLQDVGIGGGFKNKKDQLFLLKGKYNFSLAQPMVEASSYWAIKLRKRGK